MSPSLKPLIALRIALVSLVGLATLALATPSIAQTVVLRLTVERVRTSSSFDAPIGNNADFYAAVTFDDGERLKSAYIQGDDDISPGWEFSSAQIPLSRATPIPIKIEVLDRDGGLLEGKDDRADISSETGDKNIDLELSLVDCSITGDASAFCGATIVQQGTASDNAEITFRIDVDDPPASGGLVVQCTHSPLVPEPGDMVTIEATPRDLVSPAGDAGNSIQNPTFADIEIWFEDRDTPAATAVATTFSHTVGPVSADFEYGCRVQNGGRTAWTSWRRVGVGTASAFDGAIPVIYTGDRGNRIDIVFVPDSDDYLNSTSMLFLQDVQELLEEAYLRWPLYLERQDIFNFWISSGKGDAEGYQETLGIPRCVLDGPFLPWAESAVVVHADNLRDCAPRGSNYFSTEPPRVETSSGRSANTARHELGHRPFGLADEYADDGGYYQQTFFPNLFEGSGSCEADTADVGRSPSDCRGFVADTPWWFDQDWFLSEPASDDLMDDNGEPRAADIRRIDWLVGLCRGANCSPTPGAGGGEPPSDPTAGPFPSFDVDAGSKSFALGVAFSGRYLATMESLDVVKTPDPIRVSNPPLLHIEVMSADGSMLTSYDDWHPLWVHRYEDDGTESLVIVEDESAMLLLPFDPEAATAVLTDVAAGEEVMEEDLTGAVRDFCLDEPDDPDCRQADLEIVDIATVAAPAFVLFGTPSYWTMRTVVANRGPSAPEDGLLDRTVFAPPEVLVTPLATSDLVPGIDFDEERSVDLTYQIECVVPGRHTVKFVSAVATAAPAAVDLFPANDSAELSVIVDCAVPVTIDVRPKMINLNSKGVIPVLIFTTEAGQNSNPLAFDATTIDAASARFGNPATVVAGGGAAGAHDDSHGQPDVMLHFPTQSTGQTAADTEGCVLGEFALGGGTVASFFGCDGLSVK